MNKKLLLKIKKMIVKEPHRLHMDLPIMWSELEPHNSCGTIACIAGWAVLMNEADKSHKSYRSLAQPVDIPYNWPDVNAKAIKLLKIDNKTAKSLFRVDDWPAKHKTAYYDAYWDKKRIAKVTADRIDELLTKGK